MFDDRRLTVLLTAALATVSSAQESPGPWSADGVASLFTSALRTIRAGAVDMAVADVTGDGLPDIIVPTIEDVAILVGDGKGGFEETARLSAGTGPQEVEVVDLDRDGRLDIVTVNATSNDIVVLKGLGAGAFGRPWRRPLPHVAGQEIEVADFDGDGHLDVAVGSETASGSSSLDVILGVGDGTLEPTETHVGAARWNLTTADFDEDGDLDLYGASDDLGQVWIGSGDGTFAAGLELVFDHEFAFIHDFDADGHVDVHALSRWLGEYGWNNSYSVHYGVGDGTFASSWLNESSYIADAAVDFDNSGSIDLMGIGGTVVVDYAADITSPAVSTLASTGIAYRGDYSDLDGDGWRDVVAIGAQSRLLTHVRDPLGDVDGVSVARRDGQSQETIRGSPQLIDLNGDGGKEVVVACDDARLRIYGVDAQGRLKYNGQYFIDVRAFAAGDLDEDGEIDLVVREEGASKASVMFGKGAGFLADPKAVPIHLKVGRIAVLDVDGDGHLDLVDIGGGPSWFVTEIAVVLGDGDGTFGAPVVTAWSGDLEGDPVWRDVDLDGTVDLLLNDGDGQAIHLLAGQGDGAFVPTHVWPVGDIDTFAVGDLDEDGRPDLVTTQSLEGTIAVYLSNAHALLHHSSTLVQDGHASLVALDDFDGDGRLDMFLGDDYGLTCRIRLGRGDGTFGAAQHLAFDVWAHFIGAGGNDRRFAIGDANGDGAPDIVASSSHLELHTNQR